VVPRHKQSAVRRNRLKRQLREILRVEVLPRLEASQIRRDVMIRARSEAYQAIFGGLRDELVAWVEQRWLHDYSSS
jgi:ribonuclease P protein component